MEDTRTRAPDSARPERGRTQKASLAVAAGVALAILCAAFAAGYAIRQVRLARTRPEAVAQVVEEPVPQDKPHPGPGSPEPPPAVYAPVQEDQVSEPATGLEEVPLPEPEPPAPVEPRMGQRFAPWGLNLTQEEQARLREGFMDLVQRFQAMPEEERQAQMARFNGLRERFEAMSPQARQETMLQMWQVFQQWRQTDGSVEDLVNSLGLD